MVSGRWGRDPRQARRRGLPLLVSGWLDEWGAWRGEHMAMAAQHPRRSGRRRCKRPPLSATAKSKCGAGRRGALADGDIGMRQGEALSAGVKQIR